MSVAFGVTADTIRGIETQASDFEKAFLRAETEWISKARVAEILPNRFRRALFLTGRGWGKTQSICSWARRMAGTMPGSIGHVIAPTFGDLRGTVFHGVSGLLACIPGEMIKNYDKTHFELQFHNGTLLRGFSAQEPDRMRGPQCNWLLADEVAAWQYLDEMMSNITFSTRLVYEKKAADGTVIERIQPMQVFATTPRPLELIRELAEDPKVHQVRGTLYENKANLAETYIEEVAKHEGTKLGDQEIHGKILDFDESAIIKKRWIRLWPHERQLPQFEFIYTSWDTAFSEDTYDKKTGETDYTACTVYGVFLYEKKMNVLLLNSWRDKLGFPELLERAREEARIEYGHIEEAPRTTYVERGKPPELMRVIRKPSLSIIEDIGAGKSLRQMLAKEKLVMFPYNPGRASKMERLNAIAHIPASGRFWLIESKDPDKNGNPKHVSWADPFIAEVCQYSGPESTKNDDFVDTYSQAMRYFADNYLAGTVKEKIRRAMPQPVAVSNPYG